MQLAPGADVAKVKPELEDALPDDVQVLTRDELVAQEQAYFVETKPIGIMMDIGMLIACLVAVTIMIQVLATDIGNRMNEYAVLKAMGFGPFFVYGIGVTQAAILGVGGLLPAVAISAAALGFIQTRTNLGAGLDLRLSGLALRVALGAGVVVASVGAVAHRPRRSGGALLMDDGASPRDPPVPAQQASLRHRGRGGRGRRRHHVHRVRLSERCARSAVEHRRSAAR